MPAPKLHTDRDPDFVYVIYIATTAQKVWDALTDGTTFRPWWAHTQHDSSFKVGDPITYRRNGKVDLRGQILEREDLKRLVYTFHIEGPGPMHDEGPSIVTYDLEPAGNTTKLTITHGNFPKDSGSRKGVMHGWPAILSGMKSVLEGGASPDYTDWGEGESKAAADKAAREKATQQ